MEDIKDILPEEYPPKYTGIKFNGTKKCVYRVNGNFGLVFECNTIGQTHIYKWEHFHNIVDSSPKPRAKYI